MSTINQPTILLTGASGHIGGSTLDLLMKTTPLAISVLVRKPEQAATLTAAYGGRVVPILFSGFDDEETLTAAASKHDVVVNTSVGYHLTSARALQKGLAQRKASGATCDVWMIHTGGTTVVADFPISGRHVHSPLDKDFDDGKDDIYGWEKEREQEDPYFPRATDIGVVDSGIELGVPMVIVISPLIFGVGTGFFHKESNQVPGYVRLTLKRGRGLIVGDVKGVWDHVHIEDLAELYKVLVLEVLERGGKGLPSGKKGIIFSGNGRHDWREVAQGVADAAFKRGRIPTAELESVTLQELAEGPSPFDASLPFKMDEVMLERGMCSNSRTVSSVARRLGWKPTRGDEVWRKEFDAVMGEFAKQGW